MRGPHETQIVQNQSRFSSLNHQQQKVKANKKPTQNEHIISSLASGNCHLVQVITYKTLHLPLAPGSIPEYIFPSRLTAPPCLPTIAGSSCKFLVSLWIIVLHLQNPPNKKVSYLSHLTSLPFPSHVSLYGNSPLFLMESPPPFSLAQHSPERTP